MLAYSVNGLKMRTINITTQKTLTYSLTCLRIQSRTLVKVKSYQSQFQFITANPGSGKTYLGVRTALQSAASGKVCIIAFPTKVLVYENFDLANTFLKENPQFPKVDIHMLSLRDSIPSTNLLKIFLKGGAVILTLHHYFINRSDYFNHSTIYYFAQIFAKRTILLIDEAHLYLTNFDQQVSITYGYFKARDGNWVLKNSQKVKKLSEYFKYEVSNPVTEIEKGQDTFVRFKGPGRISDHNLPLEIFDTSQMRSLITAHLNPEIENLNNPNTTELKPASKEGISGVALFRGAHNLKVKVLDEIVYTGPYLIERAISISDDLSTSEQIRENCRSGILKVLKFNAFIQFLTALDYKDIVQWFQIEIRKAERDRYEIERSLLELSKRTAAKFFSLYTEYNNSSDFLDERTLLEQTINEYFLNFKEVFLENNSTMELLMPSKQDVALMIRIINATSPTLITHYPRVDNELCTDLNQFKKLAERLDVTITPENEEDPENQEIFNVKLGGPAIKKPYTILDPGLKNLNEMTGSDVPLEDPTGGDQFGVDESEVEDDQADQADQVDQTDSISKNLKKLVSKGNKPKVSISREAPFSSTLALHDCSALGFLKNQYLPVYLVSATFSENLVSKTHLELGDAANFTKTESSTKKLNKILLLHTTVDYFSNMKGDRKTYWETFGSYFWEKITKPTVAEDSDEGVYALLMLPSFRKVENFYSFSVLQNSPHFSLIEENLERKEGMGFTKKGPGALKISSRVTSILSALGAGVCLPNHKMLITSCDVLKPSSVLRTYKDLDPIVGKYIEAHTALWQGINRSSRRTKIELLDPSIPANRILFINKSDVFPQMIDLLRTGLAELYEQVEIVDLWEFDEQLATIF